MMMKVKVQELKEKLKSIEQKIDLAVKNIQKTEENPLKSKKAIFSSMSELVIFVNCLNDLRIDSLDAVLKSDEIIAAELGLEGAIIGEFIQQNQPRLSEMISKTRTSLKPSWSPLSEMSKGSFSKSKTVVPGLLQSKSSCEPNQSKAPSERGSLDERRENNLLVSGKEGRPAKTALISAFIS
jgi:hypothetical protein